VPNRQLAPHELTLANKLLECVRQRLVALSGDDRDLLFAYRRKIAKELTYDERRKPMVRHALKRRKYKEQDGLCAICGNELPVKYTVLDRLNAADGYSAENTRLIHQECDQRVQAERGYV
jgi:5-methylcytosine-specific restriction endonuclease McrA